jgi:hypothetical protein
MTINSPSTQSGFRKPNRPLRKVMLTLSTVALLTIFSGCARTVKVIPADKASVRMPAGKAFTPSIDGWFFPDALALEIREQLSKRRLDETK